MLNALRQITAFSTLVLVLTGTSAYAESNPLQQEFLIEEVDPFRAERKYFGDVSFTLMGRSLEDQFANSRWGRTIIEANLGARYEDWLEGRLSVVQLLTSGAASYQMGVTESRPSSGTAVDEARLSVTPSRWSKFSAGILSIQLSPILSQMQPQAQAGGEVGVDNRWETRWGSFRGSLSANQSIPTSRDSGNLIIDEFTNPLLTTATVFAEAQNDNINARFRLSAAHFEYTDLLSAAAADSVRTGSTVVGMRDVQFLYEFRGKEYAASYRQQIGLSHAFEFRASQIYNERAPSDINKGQQARIEYIRTFDKWEIVPSLTFFRMESDALPSLYSLGAAGFTNRKGYTAGLRAIFPKERFNIFASYTNAQAIREAGVVRSNAEQSTFQVDREVFTLGAEVQYAVF